MSNQNPNNNYNSDNGYGYRGPIFDLNKTTFYPYENRRFPVRVYPTPKTKKPKGGKKK